MMSIGVYCSSAVKFVTHLAFRLQQKYRNIKGHTQRG